nr:hypothetical protein [Paracoccus indicus]
MARSDLTSAVPMIGGARWSRLTLPHRALCMIIAAPVDSCAGASSCPGCTSCVPIPR